MESKHTCPRIHIAGHRTAKIERNICYLRRPVAFVPTEHGFRTKQTNQYVGDSVLKRTLGQNRVFIGDRGGVRKTLASQGEPFDCFCAANLFGCQ